METRLSNIFKTTNFTNLTKVIQQNSYRVLQVTSKWKTLKQPVYFLKAVEYFGKSCKTTLFRKPTEVSQNKPTFISIGPHITKSQPYKNMKNLWVFLAIPFSKKGLLTFGSFNESNICAKVYHI